MFSVTLLWIVWKKNLGCDSFFFFALWQQASGRVEEYKQEVNTDSFFFQEDTSVFVMD